MLTRSWLVLSDFLALVLDDWSLLLLVRLVLPGLLIKVLVLSWLGLVTVALQLCSLGFLLAFPGFSAAPLLVSFILGTLELL